MLSELHARYRGKSLSSRDTKYSFASNCSFDRHLIALVSKKSLIKMKDFFKKFKKLFKGAKSGIDASSGTRAPEGSSP